MIRAVQAQRVIADRPNGSTCTGVTQVDVYFDVRNGKGEVIPDKNGLYLGTAIRLDSGHVLYCHRDKMSAVT